MTLTDANDRVRAMTVFPPVSLRGQDNEMFRGMGFMEMTRAIGELRVAGPGLGMRRA
jgi:hypothetical protein